MAENPRIRPPVSTDIYQYKLIFMDGAEGYVIYDKNFGEDDDGMVLRAIAMHMSQDDLDICSVDMKKYIEKGYVLIKIPEIYISDGSNDPRRPTKLALCDFHKNDKPYTYIPLERIDANSMLGKTMKSRFEYIKTLEKLNYDLHTQIDRLKIELRRSSEGWMEKEKIADAVSERVLGGIGGMFLKKEGKSGE